MSSTPSLSTLPCLCLSEEMYGTTRSHFAPAIGFSEALHCSAGAVTTRFLADHPIALQIGSTVFVHGGVLPQHAELGLERINQETRAWMRGEALRMPSFLSGRQAIVWAREYSAGAPFLVLSYAGRPSRVLLTQDVPGALMKEGELSSLTICAVKYCV